jgi:hypothetical protein
MAIIRTFNITIVTAQHQPVMVCLLGRRFLKLDVVKNTPI